MVIILSGPDLYRSHQRLAVLRQAFRRKHDQPGFGLVTIDGMTATPEEMRTAVTTNGFFSTKRFIALDHYTSGSQLEAASLSELLTPLTQDDTTIVVIRKTDQVKKGVTTRRKSTKATKKTSARRVSTDLDIPQAKVELFPLLSQAEVVTWSMAEAKSRGGQISRPAAERLALMCQADTWRIASELDKLVTYVAARPITPEDVEMMVTSPYQSNIFAVTDALGQGQRGQALAVVHHELLAGTHPLVLVATIAQQVRTLLMVQAAGQTGTTPAAIAQQTGLHPYVIQKSLGQAKRFSAEQLRRWHHRLVTIDDQLKSTPLDAETLLDVLLLDRA